MEQLTKAIKFWVTDSEKKQINIACSLSGKSKGDFFRSSVLDKTKMILEENHLMHSA